MVILLPRVAGGPIFLDVASGDKRGTVDGSSAMSYNRRGAKGRLRGEDAVNVANDKALRDLEFDRLRSLVRAHASSSLGEEAVEALVPVAEREAIEAAADEVCEAVRFLGELGGFSLGGARDLAPLLARAKEGIGLDGEDFLIVLQTVDATNDLRERLASAPGYPRLGEHAGRLRGGEDVARGIRRAIDERGAVRDDATAELDALNKKRRTAEARVETKLRQLMERSPDLVSEPVITRRRGRLVLPVKSGVVAMNDYVVHDRSATGQTLYAEPTWLVAENNVVAELAEAIREEVRRILRELTEAFLAAEASFLRDRAVLSHLDGLFARAGFAVAYHCSFPRLGTALTLRGARHPLLPRDRAVPISLSLGDGKRMTVITGPNTGGKTVTLKTLGLLTLMTQAGIPIPASPDSEIRVVTAVRTDIGDEQSIEQNLSTFSAHMKNTVSILGEARADTLILLDELGAGTDPQEGAALGLAIIEALLASGALVAVSTHLTPLKYFAIRHPEIKTASMEFDLATLGPSFRVVEGVPGRSNAFIIAERLGLAAELIDRARGFLSSGEIRAEDIIDELHRERQALIGHREAAEADRSAARALRETYEGKLRAFEQERERALSREVRRLEDFLQTAQRDVESLLARARADGVEAARAKEALSRVVELREQASEERKALAEAAEPTPLSDEEIEPGRLVHVRSVDAKGRIVHVDPRGKVVVDLDGGIRVSTEAKDLEAPRRAPQEDGRRETSIQMRRPRPSQVPLQLDLRGLTVNEALRRVEEYLDALLRADLRNARILHGKGTGALRDAVRSYLSSCSFVTRFGYAPPNLGGDGVTEIELAGEPAEN
ncbi:MAG: endonuclease MutS2 [Candidatus Bipolaricaulota bacterium]